MIDITFIIPAYNCSNSISKAVTSIEINSKNINYEILIVENGSTDNSNFIIAQLAKKNKCIRVFHSKKGVSRARNLGIRNAKGKWLFFLDADDYLIDNINEFEDSDLIIWNYKVAKKKKELSATAQIINTPDKIKRTIIHMLNDPTKFMTVWGKLFNKEIINKNQLLFDENIEVGEDSEFFLQYLLNVKTITFNPDYVYHYSMDVGSTTRSQNIQLIDKYQRSMNAIWNKSRNLSSDIRQAINGYIAINFIVAVVRGIYVQDIGFINKSHKMRMYAQNFPFKSAINKITLNKNRNLKLMPMFLIKYHLSWLANIIFQARSLQNKNR